MSPNTARDALLTEYTTQVSKLKDRSEKERMMLLDWAMINYDATSEVQKLLEEGSGKGMAGYSFVTSANDPVLVMEKDTVGDLGLTREGILELSRTVDKKVLKRIADMLRYIRVSRMAITQPELIRCCRSRLLGRKLPLDLSVPKRRRRYYFESFRIWLSRGFFILLVQRPSLLSSL